MREVFLYWLVTNKKILQFLRILPGLTTIVSAKLWLKQEILKECTIFALISSFNLKFLSTFFTSTLDKLHCCWWKCFHLCLTLTPPCLLLLFTLIALFFHLSSLWHEFILSICFVIVLHVVCLPACCVYSLWFFNLIHFYWYSFIWLIYLFPFTIVFWLSL